MKTEVPCHSRLGTIKIPPCLKPVNDEKRPECLQSSPGMMDDVFIPGRDEKQYQNNQAICFAELAELKVQGNTIRKCQNL